MKLLNFFFLATLVVACAQFATRAPTGFVDTNSLNQKGAYPASLVLKSEVVPGKIKVFFNLPPYTNPGGVGLIPAMKSHIEAARKSIKLAIFQFNHPEIFNALKAAASRGVKIYLSTDLCYSGKEGYKEYFDDLRSHLSRVGQSGSQVVDDGTPSCDTQFNHNKYIIFDDEIAWFGSFNPTAHGSVENVELSISLRDKTAAKILSLDFDQLMSGQTKVAKKGVYSVVQNGTEEIRILDDKEIAGVIRANGIVSYPKVVVGGHEFEFILSPKVKSLSRIVEEVYQSQQEILFSSFAIADAMLISALINKHRGTNVSPVLLLPHPGEKPGVVIRDNGDRLLAETEISAYLAQTNLELERSLRSVRNYQTPKGELKGIFRYFYPYNARVRPVKVEGIFNSKVIDAENTKDRLVSASVKLFRATINGDLHNKLFLIDEKVTIFGSHNFSQAAETANDELTVIIKSAAITKFLKEEYYEKTKLFAVPSNPALSIPKLAITEIKSETAQKLPFGRKTIDAGDYVELYNFGDEDVTLFGLRLDDRFFPATDGETFPASTNAGFSGELVGFVPPQIPGRPGTKVYDPTSTILKPKASALVVGTHFHPDYYVKHFEASFLAKYGRKPQRSEYPLLVTIGAFASNVLGDATSGLRSRDKLTLYHIDNHTVIDRFAHPVEIAKLDSVLARETSEKILSQIHLKKNQESREERVRFYLSGQQSVEDEFFGLRTGYSTTEEWKVADQGSPGVVSFSSRTFASVRDVVVIEGKIAESARSFRDGYVVLERGVIKRIIYGSSLPKEFPAPVVKDVAIFPGLIDGHNHLKFNFFPLWITNKFFNNRYEWPELSVYSKGIKELYKGVYSEIPQCLALTDEGARNKCLAEERCHVLRLGEIKALIGGTTAIQGSTSFDETTSDVSFRGITPYFIGSGNRRTLSRARVIENLLDECSLDGAQNLERLSIAGQDTVRSTAMNIGSEAFGAHLLGTEKFKSSGSCKIVDEYNNDSTFKLSSPETWQEKTNAFYFHLGEGSDEASRAEWDTVHKLGLALPQSVVIHGLAFKDSEMRTMAQHKVPLIWSPTSNALLYKNVARVDLARRNNVLLGLGSDWSLSGTKSMLYELKVARKISERKYPGVLTAADLFEMATVNNARIAGMGNMMGKVAENFSADFFLVDKSVVSGSPADTLLALKESDIESTWVKGIPQTGETEEIKRLNVELGLNLKVLELKKLDPSSCERETAFLTTDKGAAGIQKVIDRYSAAFGRLSPSVKAGLNKEFSKIDGFCQEKEPAAVEKALEAVR